MTALPALRIQGPLKKTVIEPGSSVQRLAITLHVPPHSTLFPTWPSSCGGDQVRKQKIVGLILGRFGVPLDALIVEHGAGSVDGVREGYAHHFGYGAVPDQFQRRVLVDFRYDRNGPQDGRLLLNCAADETARALAEPALSLGWPAIPQAIVWYNFRFFLMGHASLTTFTATVKAVYLSVYSLLPEGGLFIIGETREGEIDKVRKEVDEFALPFRSLDVIRPREYPKEGFLVYRK